MTIFTKESLETLKKRVDLVDVMGSFIELKRQGASYKALCPFHEEKTPSFILQRGDSHYHCFGCGAHGDAISFLMNHQRLSFVEAVEFLADKFQVILEKTETDEVKGPNRKEMKEALELTARLYHALLLHTEEGHLALRYLYARGISLDFIKQFEIGLSPTQPILKKIFALRGISDEILEAAGLISRASNGHVREFFQDRIMFPIRAKTGAVIAFSGRKFKEETYGGKYINTPETPLFKKSRVLFGLNYSRKRIARDRIALIVEGQIDALRLIYSGFDFTVAGQGTAFGEEHVEELSTLGILVAYLAFDQDIAGMNATLKVGDLFQKIGIEVKIISLPEGYDPDLFIKKKGAEAFSNLMSSSTDYISFLVKYHSREIDLTTPGGKNQLAILLQEQIRKWKHELMVHESLKKLAKLLEVKESLLGTYRPPSPSHFLKKSDTAGALDVDPNYILEVDLLGLIYRGYLLYPEMTMAFQKYLESDSFKVPISRKLFDLFIETFKAKEKIDLLKILNELDIGAGQKIIQDLTEKKVNIERGLPLFQETLKKLLDRNWMLKREEILEKMNTGVFSEEEELAIAKEFQSIPKLNITI